MKSLALLLLALLIGGSFSGCSVDQRRQLMDEAKTYLVDQFAQLKPQVEAWVDAKLLEKEKANLADLDKKLAEIAAIDPASGAKITLTWKNFDADQNGSLDLAELGKASAYMTTRVAEKVAKGEMTTSDAKKYATGGAGTLALLAAIALYNRYVKSKQTPPGTSPSAPGATIAGK